MTERRSWISWYNDAACTELFSREWYGTEADPLAHGAPGFGGPVTEKEQLEWEISDSSDAELRDGKYMRHERVMRRS